MNAPEAWLLLTPLAWGTLAFVCGPRWGALCAALGLLLQAVCAWSLVGALATRGPYLHAVGGWPAPLGIELAVDGLSVLMLLLTQAIAIPMAVYAHGWLRASGRAHLHFWPLFGYLLTALQALFLAADLFNIYVALELLGLTAVGLVAVDGTPAQLRAALRYLLVSLLAASAYLLGVALIYGSFGTVAIASLRPQVTTTLPPLAVLAGSLMVLGLMAKTAIVPFHTWLPPAHGSAPAPVSALLSALVVKASFYVLLRLQLTLFAGHHPALDWLPALCGGIAIVYGSWRAWRVQELKMLVAYSTVAQLGYLFLLLPLLGARELALAAAALQMVAHALAKAALFAAAGIALLITGGERVAVLASLAGRHPVTWFAFGLAAITLTGLPPSGGFLAKWLLIEAALARGQWLMVGLIIGGGLLGAAYLYRIVSLAFVQAPAQAPAGRVPRSMEWMAFLLAAASVLVGLEGNAIVALLATGVAT